MGVNTHFISLSDFAFLLGLKGIFLYLIILNIMEQLKGKIDLQLNQLELCYMIKIFITHFGLKHLIQQSTFKIDALTPYQRIPPQRKYSQALKPNRSHLRLSGCPIYIHIPKEKRTKLEPSRKKGIFIGYSETTKGYRIYIIG